ncbi:hypothetical protein H7U40_00005, partial [Flavonifractor plautii]|nr:hypothetical protein [Flavonifractor plautii]
MLEVEHLCFSYGKREVLRGVDLRAEPSSITGPPFPQHQIEEEGRAREGGE